MAGLKQFAVNFSTIYNCYNNVVIAELEGLESCEKREGGTFVENDIIELGGPQLISAHARLLSHSQTSYPGSMFTITDGATQLSGSGDVRQEKDAEISLIHGQGGVLPSHATLVLDEEAAL